MGQGGGSVGVYENRVTFRLYVEETDDDANKVSRRPDAYPEGKRNKSITYLTGNYRL
ncbi:MAG: hypothetical protein ABSE54_03740 [Smithella sp.]